ncbi:MAG: hypothetical protein P4L93_03320 [Coriobacteriia bacterium]|nr:hypothetical protein [Coriobacteriia bacterium]
MSLVLAAAFFLFFQLTKQIPALAAANASANDPYDAIGSFGIQAAAVFGLLAVGRCFWWSRAGSKLSERRRLLLVRTGVASVLAVTVTLAGDIMAMARQPGVVIGSLAGRGYALLLGGMVALALWVGLYVGLASKGVGGPLSARAWLRSAASSLVFVALLAVYPEVLRTSVAGELFTVLVGVALLVAPMRFLLLALVPDLASAPNEPAITGRVVPSWLPWVAVSVAGIVVGLLLVSAEMFHDSGGSTPPVARLLLVASVYVGLEVAGLLVGYAMLRGPLGLVPPPNKRIERTQSALS